MVGFGFRRLFGRGLVWGLVGASVGVRQQFTKGLSWGVWSDFGCVIRRGFGQVFNRWFRWELGRLGGTVGVR